MFFFEILKAIFFGIVEGVTEWLPVSSTGHMLLAEELLHLDMSDSFYRVFEVVIQLGAVAAVAVRYREKLSPFGKTTEQRRETAALWRVTAIGVIPSAIIGALLDDVIERLFYTPTVVAIMLLLYGVGFIAAEIINRKRAPSVTSLSQIDNKKAVLVGLFQTLSLIPGTSRSGATILGAYICGASRTVATEFSFLLAIPTMLGAGLLRGVKFLAEGNRVEPSELVILAVGIATAYLVSRIAVDFLTDFVSRRGFLAFGIYRIILGGALLWFFF